MHEMKQNDLVENTLLCVMSSLGKFCAELYSSL